MLKFVLYIAYGTLMLVMAVNSLKTSETRTASLIIATFANVAAITGFIYAGIEIERQKKNKPSYEPVKLKDLNSATFVVNENPYVSVYNPESLFRYFMLVECITGHNIGRPVIVEIPKDKDNRYKLQVAMGKYLEKIKTGEGFEINKDLSITKLGT